jgi:hypothetical protein
MLGVPLYKLGLGGLRLCGKAIIFNNVTSTPDFSDTSFTISTFGSVSLCFSCNAYSNLGHCKAPTWLLWRMSCIS